MLSKLFTTFRHTVVGSTMCDMSLSARHLLTAAATAVLAASAPTAATAAPVLSNNACSVDGKSWGTLPLELSATAAQRGRNLDVSAIQPSVTIPSWLPSKVASYGALIDV